MDLITKALLENKIRSVLSGVASVNVNNNTIEWTFNDETTASMTFPKPKDGVSPIIVENPDNTSDIYKLNITDNNRMFTSPNLMGKSIDQSELENELTDYIDNKIQELHNNYSNSENILKNKRILFVGDSICQGVGTGDPTDGGKEKPYPWWIKTWNPSVTVHNEGRGGYTIAKKAGQTNTFVDRIDNGEFEAYQGNVDYIVVQGGINDVGNNVKLGYIRNGYTGELDLYTYAGGLEYVLRYFARNFQPSKIFFMTTYNVQSYGQHKQMSFYGLASELCNKLGVQFVDCFGMIPTSQFMGDYATQLHANYRVHRDYIAPLVDNALKYGTNFGSRTQNYYNKNAPMSLGFHSGKAEFTVGETFSTADWRFNSVTLGGVYINVSDKVVYDASEIDMATPGTYQVYVSYANQGISFGTTVQVTVASNGSVVLSSISASKTKTQYTIGETLSIDDVMVTATYSDGSSRVVTDASEIDPGDVDMGNAGTYYINISYTEGEVTKAVTVQIVINATPLVLESVTAVKTKTTYYIGETVSTDDITVTAVYDDSSSRVVTGWSVGSLDTSTAGTKSLEITYTEAGVTRTYTIEITVVEGVERTVVDTGNVTGTQTNVSVGTWTLYDDGELVLEKSGTSQMGNINQALWEWADHATEVTKIVVGTGFNFVGGNAFKGFTELVEVVLTDTVFLGANSFDGCVKLTTIDLTKTSRLGMRALATCTSLPSEIVLGATVLDGSSLYYIPQVTSVRWTGQPKSINAEALKHITAYNSTANLKDIYVPWSEGDVANAQWGATAATVHYGTV